MDYQKAKDIRKESFGTLLAEQEGGAGASLKKAISLKTQAKVAGIKQTFDPMNIAKKMTFGSNWAPAMVGKFLGSKQENINFFTGAKKKSIDKPLEGPADVEGMSTPTDVLGLIYRLMLRIEEDKKLTLEQEQNKKEGDQKEEDAFYNELLTAITGRKKPKKKGKKKEPKAEKEEPKKEPPKEPPKSKKTTAKETPKATKEVPKEAPKPTSKTEKVSPKISTAAKVAGGAAVIASMPTLGASSAKFESNGDPSTVSSGMMGGGKADPGGISYGTYQMSSVMGVADDFVKKSQFKSDFAGLKAGTPEFGIKWKEIAKDPKRGKDFADAQHDYIKKTHFDPAAQKAQKMGYNLNDPGVADAIWSLSVQHGGVQKVLDLSKSNMGGVVSPDSKTQIKSLYKARDEYTKGQFNKRYTAEATLALNKSTDTGVQIAQASTQNKDMKEDLVKQKSTNIQISSNVQTTTKSSPAPTSSGDDTSPYLKKASV